MLYQVPKSNSEESKEPMYSKDVSTVSDLQRLQLNLIILKGRYIFDEYLF